MKIQWLGHACFLITTADGVKIATDPYDSSIGLKLPPVSADIVTTSHGHFDHAAVSEIHGTPKVVNSPEGLDYGKVKIRGVATYHDEHKGAQRGPNIMFVISAADDGGSISVCHAGDLGHLLTPEMVEGLKGLDVFMVPVGGTYTLDAAGARKVVDQIGPRIVIPMHYKIPGLSLGVEGADKFLAGQQEVTRLKELEITGRDLPPKMRIVVLERSAP